MRRAHGWMAAVGAMGAAVVVVVVAHPALATGDGQTVIARARATEAEQLRGLAGSSVALHTQGWVSDGTITRRIESFRRLDYRADGKVANVFQHGLVDGQPVTEGELRHAIGAQANPPERQRDMLGEALAPLHSPEVTVTAVGPAPDGGYALRCVISDGALVNGITLIVDEATGRKRTAVLEMAGFRARLADRLENVLTYGDDGAPAAFRSRFHAKFAWIERSAEFNTRRVPTPAPVASPR